MIAKKEFLQEYVGYRDGKIYPVVILHMYRDCNLNCQICYVDDSVTQMKKGEVLCEESLEKVVKYAAENDLCLYTGIGEPFLKWDEYTKPVLLKAVKKYNARIIISTNGLWGNDDRIIDEVIELAPEVICFSIDAFHNVPIETLNHVIERLSDDNVKTQIYMSQIYNNEFPQGHKKPIHYDDMHKIFFGLWRNSETDQKMIFHDKNGRIIKGW